MYLLKNKIIMQKLREKTTVHISTKKKTPKNELKCYSKNWTSFPKNSDLRKKMLEVYKQKYEGKTVLNLKTGIIIRFELYGAKKTTKHGSMYAEKAALITILDKICKYGFLHSLGEPKKGDKEKKVVGYLNFRAPVIIDGKQKLVELPVRIKNNGNFHYCIDIPLTYKQANKNIKKH
jgi:hypothetical protein